MLQQIILFKIKIWIKLLMEILCICLYQNKMFNLYNYKLIKISNKK